MAGSSSEQKARHLLKLAESTLKDLPALSRFYRHQARSLKLKSKKIGYSTKNPHFLRYPGDGHCPYCCSLWTPNNHHIRLQPKMRLTRNIKNLLVCANTKSRSLGKFQKKLVDMYCHSCNRMIITCHVCKQRVRLSGQPRRDRIQQLAQESFVQEVAEIPKKSKKERKKEKKKMKHKREKEHTIQDLTSGSLNSSLSKSLLTPSPSNQPKPVVARTPTATPKLGLLTLFPGDSSLNKSFSTQSSNSSSSRLAMSSPMNQTPRSVPRESSSLWLKPQSASTPLTTQGSSKKNKKRQKALHQQLQQALKDRQNSKANSSLSDFLAMMKQSGLK